MAIKPPDNDLSILCIQGLHDGCHWKPCQCEHHKKEGKDMLIPVLLANIFVGGVGFLLLALLLGKIYA